MKKRIIEENNITTGHDWHVSETTGRMGKRDLMDARESGEDREKKTKL